jgi:hypothetical protein
MQPIEERLRAMPRIKEGTEGVARDLLLGCEPLADGVALLFGRASTTASGDAETPSFTLASPSAGEMIPFDGLEYEPVEHRFRLVLRKARPKPIDDIEGHLPKLAETELPPQPFSHDLGALPH